MAEERKNNKTDKRNTTPLPSHFSLLAHTFHEEGGWESHHTLLQRDKEGTNVLVKWGAGKLQAPSRWRSSSCWSLSGRSPTACYGSPETSPQTSSCWCKAVPWWTPPQSPRSHLLTKHIEDCNLEGVVLTGKSTQSSLPAVKLLSRARKHLWKHSRPQGVPTDLQVTFKHAIPLCFLQSSLISLKSEKLRLALTVCFTSLVVQHLK